MLFIIHGHRDIKFYAFNNLLFAYLYANCLTSVYKIFNVNLKLIVYFVKDSCM